MQSLIIRFTRKFAVVTGLIGCFFLHALGQTYPAPVINDTTGYGNKIQRTMKLLATSTAQHRNSVKIEIYGQSWEKQEWNRILVNWLKSTYPTVDFTFRNHSIGGCASDCLQHPAPLEINGFYPDLLIFHVGINNNASYDTIVNGARRNTACELMIYNDFYPAGSAGTASYQKNTVGPRLHAEVVDAWQQFQDYTNVNKTVSLIDNTGHLSPQGNWLLAELFKAHFKYKPNLNSDPDGLVKMYAAGSDFSFSNGQLSFKFAGNRIDAVTDQAATLSSTGASVLIDGKKPSQYATCYFATRPNDELGVDWTVTSTNVKDWPWTCGGIYNVFWTSVPIPQKWTVTVKNLNMANKYFDFDLTGSNSGLDGTGNNKTVYNGKMILKPDEWALPTSSYWINPGFTIANGYTITWSIEAKNTDTYTPASPSDASREHVITLAQGLENRDHTLELTALGDGMVPVKAFRVYRPFLLRQATAVPDPKPLKIILQEKTFVFIKDNRLQFTVYNLNGRKISSFVVLTKKDFSQALDGILPLKNLKPGVQTLIIDSQNAPNSMWNSIRNPKNRYVVMNLPD